MPRVIRWRLALGLLLVGTVTWVLAHEGHVALPSRGAQVDAENGYIVLSREAYAALDVKATELTTTPLPQTVLAYAEVAARWGKHVYVATRVPGRIQQVFVQAGDTVDAGQTIATIQSAELENLQTEIVRTEAELVLAKQVVTSLKQSGTAVPPRSLIEAENLVQQLNIAVVVNRAKWQGLGLAEADYEQLRRDPKRRLEALPVPSPLAGTVIHIDLTPGKMVDVGEHLAEVLDTSKVLARIGVLEAHSAQVRIGYEVALRFTARPGLEQRASVVSIDQALDPQTNLNYVWAELSNPKGTAGFLPGMSGQAVIYLPVPKEARVIPATALIDDGLAQYVLVEEANTERQAEYRRKNVVVRRRLGDAVEVQSSELFPGDRVVTQAAHELGNFFVPGVLKLSPEATRTLGLRTERVGEHALDTVLQVDGRVDLRPEQRVVVSAPLAGQISKLHVTQNATVTKGQVLAEVFSLEFQNLQLDLIREQLTHDFLQELYKTLRLGGEAIARRSMLEAETAWLSSKHRLNNFKRRLALAGLADAQLTRLVAQQQLVNTIPIRATASGVVVRFDKLVGQGIKAEEPLFEIHDLRQPRIEAFVGERDLARIHQGQAARIRFVDDPTRTLTAVVAPSTRLVTLDDQALSVWLDFAAAVSLKRGQLTRVAIVISSLPTQIAIPRSALLQEGARAYVFVLQPNGEWQRRLIETGPADDRFIAVRRGLQVGETIAVEGVAGLQTAFAAIR